MATLLAVLEGRASFCVRRKKLSTARLGPSSWSEVTACPVLPPNPEHRNHQQEIKTPGALLRWSYSTGGWQGSLGLCCLEPHTPSYSVCPLPFHDASCVLRFTPEP